MLVLGNVYEIEHLPTFVIRSLLYFRKHSFKKKKNEMDMTINGGAVSYNTCY